MKRFTDDFRTAFMVKTIRLSALALATGTTLSCFGLMNLAQAGTLSEMVATALPNNQVELRMSFSEAPPVPQAYQLENPNRLVLDLPGTKNTIQQRTQSLDIGTARRLSVVDNSERTRVVIDLNEAGRYTTRVSGNDLILRMMPESASNATPAASVPQTITPVDTAARRSSLGVTAVNFRKGNNNEGQVLINLASAGVPVDVQQQGSRIIARFLGSRLPSNLLRRLNVDNMGTPVSTVNAYNDGNNGVVVIQPQGNFEYMAYQADNRLTISVKRPAPTPLKQLREPTYSGQRLSLNFQDIEVRSVLQLIADFTGLNLVASDTVQGRITIRLQNVPWDQALDIILRTKGLDKRRNGNVILIAPAVEITEREKQEIMALQQVEQLAPLRTEYIQMNYARAEDILKLLTQARSNQGNMSSGINNGVAQNTANQGLLSNRGSASVDARTNTLIIQDTALKIDEIRNLLAKLDVPVRQVMIEARIVRATDNFSKELGVKWGILSDGIATNRRLLVGGSETTLFDLSRPTTSTINGVQGVSYNITRPSNLNVDLGVTAAGASRIALGLLNVGNTMLDLELSALQADGKGEVVATPKVLTTDKQKARVAAGTQIPYQTATASGATAVQFINAELSLEVTPNITPDGRIGMELLVNSDTPSNVQNNGQLAIDTNRIATNVLVDDGQTVVLGGIFQNQTTNSTTKTPFLGDLPYLGRLFKKDQRLNNKQELLIFVTPRLVTPTGGSLR